MYINHGVLLRCSSLYNTLSVIIIEGTVYELLTLQEHIRSHQLFIGVRAAPFFIFLCSALHIVVCPFSLFCHCVGCPPSICGFGIPLLCHQTFLVCSRLLDLVFRVDVVEWSRALGSKI